MSPRSSTACEKTIMPKPTAVATPQLRTPRLLLRAPEEQDAESIFAYAKDPEVSRYTLWEPHQSVEDTRQFLSNVRRVEAEGSGWVWAIVAGKQLIGTCGLVNLVREHKRADLGFAIAREHWRHGYTSEAVHAVFSFAFRSAGLHRVQSKCLIENVASAALLEKLGMTFEGVLRRYEFIKGAYRDLQLFSILREEFLAPPKEDFSL